VLVESLIPPKNTATTQGEYMLVTYLIPLRCTATAQGEIFFSLTLMSKGEKVW
jgi:hypothetical protein